MGARTERLVATMLGMRMPGTVGAVSVRLLRTWHVRGFVIIAGATATAGCGGSDSIRDQKPAEVAGLETWELSESPLFLKAGLEVDGDSLFFGPIIPVTFKKNGGIVAVTTAGDFRVVYLDSLGVEILAHGGTGQGPGEFRRPLMITPVGDTIAVWDRLNGRVTFFTEEGFADQVRLALPSTQTYVGVLSNGSIVATPVSHMGPAAAMRFSEDRVPQGASRPYHLFDRSGERIATLLGPAEPGTSALELTRVGDDEPRRFIQLGPSCLPVTMHATVGDRILIAEGSEGQLFSMDRNSGLAVVFGSPSSEIVRPELVDLLERWLDDETFGALTSASKTEALERIGAAGDPLPTVWSAMIPDLEGGVWLQRASCYSSWGFSDPVGTWEVVDSLGRLTAVVRVPADLTVLSVHGKRVLVSLTDDLNVPYLALYEVER
jgi:hypothetical protein